jgi:hypothetical protein
MCQRLVCTRFDLFTCIDIHQIHQTYVLENLRNKAATERRIGDELLAFFLKQTIEKKESALTNTTREIEMLKGDMSEISARSSLRTIPQDLGNRPSSRQRRASEVYFNECALTRLGNEF